MSSGPCGPIFKFTSAAIWQKNQLGKKELFSSSNLLCRIYFAFVIFANTVTFQAEERAEFEMLKSQQYQARSMKREKKEKRKRVFDENDDFKRNITCNSLNTVMMKTTSFKRIMSCNAFYHYSVIVDEKKVSRLITKQMYLFILSNFYQCLVIAFVYMSQIFHMVLLYGKGCCS